MRLPLLLLPLSITSSCGESPPPEAADPILASAGGVEVTESEYRAYLHEAIGERHLERLVLRGLLEAEAEKLGVEPPESIVSAAIESAWAERLRRAGGDEMAAREFLIEEGRHDLQSWERAVGAAERERAIEDAICRTTRIIDEDALENAFELRYGADGFAIVARGVVFDSARVAEELERSAPGGVDEAAVRNEITRRAAQVRAELEAGEPLRTVVDRYSQDSYGLRHGGALSAGRLEELRAETRSVPIGTLHGPVFIDRDSGEFEAVVFVVEERVFTAFEEVRDDLERELRNEPARAEERAELVRRLLEENPVALH